MAKRNKPISTGAVHLDAVYKAETPAQRMIRDSLWPPIITRKGRQSKAQKRVQKFVDNFIKAVSQAYQMPEYMLRGGSKPKEKK